MRVIGSFSIDQTSQSDLPTLPTVASSQSHYDGETIAIFKSMCLPHPIKFKFAKQVSFVYLHSDLKLHFGLITANSLRKADKIHNYNLVASSCESLLAKGTSHFPSLVVSRRFSSSSSCLSTAMTCFSIIAPARRHPLSGKKSAK